ncbi:hypothetical protein ACQ86N_37905 [Puia sp. P3]|uniref:hypothetical protein n=1 Tax=Puia sp. P3 TaxID=3423952 RepID=UPI003D67AFF4
MKQLLPALLLAGGLIFWMACNKSTSSQTPPNASSLTLTLSDQSVKKGQPLMVSLPQGVSSSGVKWSVSPDSGARLTASAGSASVLFFKAGRYKISANYASGSDSARRDSCYGTVVVADTVYVPPMSPSFDTTAVDRDTLTLTPMSDTSDLILVAQSSRRYGCLPYYIYSISAGVNTGISMQFPWVVSNHINGCGDAGPAVSALFLQNSIKDWPNGTYPFSANYSGATYSGSLTITGSDYTFTWNYTTGVIISPLHIKR